MTQLAQDQEPLPVRPTITPLSEATADETGIPTQEALDQIKANAAALPEAQAQVANLQAAIDAKQAALNAAHAAIDAAIAENADALRFPNFAVGHSPLARD